MLHRIAALTLVSCLLAEISGLTVVSREEWGARAPKSRIRIQGAVPYVIIHHADTPACSGDACKARVQSIQNYHMDSRGWEDIGYSFLIGGDGKVYEGRGWGIVGAHTQGYNRNGYGICFIGTFMTTSPTEAALQSAKDLIAEGVRRGFVVGEYKLVGHRDVLSTDCPGDKLHSIIKRWPHYGKRFPTS